MKVFPVRRYRPQMEMLESRLAPVSGITAVLDGNNLLQINGTNLTDYLYILQNGNAISVWAWNQNAAGWEIANFPGTAPNVINGIQANLGDGNDYYINYGNVSKNQTVNRGNGHDYIVLSGGTNLVNGDAGNDLINAYNCTNGGTYNGQADNDTIYGTNGNDTCMGGLGNDLVYGFGGHNLLYGNEGNDWCIGGVGNDYLDAGSANENVYGGGGIDFSATTIPTISDVFHNDGQNDWVFMATIAAVVNKPSLAQRLAGRVRLLNVSNGVYNFEVKLFNPNTLQDVNVLVPVNQANPLAYWNFQGTNYLLDPIVPGYGSLGQELIMLYHRAYIRFFHNIDPTNGSLFYPDDADGTRASKALLGNVNVQVLNSPVNFATIQQALQNGKIVTVKVTQGTLFDINFAGGSFAITNVNGDTATLFTPYGALYGFPSFGVTSQQLVAGGFVYKVTIADPPP